METSEEETIHICYFISETGHKATDDIYKFLFLPPILYSLCLQPAGQCSLPDEVTHTFILQWSKLFFNPVSLFLHIMND